MEESQVEQGNDLENMEESRLNWEKDIEKTKRLNNTKPTKNNIEKTKIEQHEPLLCLDLNFRTHQ